MTQTVMDDMMKQARKDIRLTRINTVTERLMGVIKNAENLIILGVPERDDRRRLQREAFEKELLELESQMVISFNTPPKDTIDE